MNRITTTWMLLTAMIVPAALASPLWADGPTDLNAALNELKKPAEQQDAALIDAKLASAVAASGDLWPYQYRQARMLQQQRRVAALTDKTAPEKRQALNDAYVAIAGQIADLYLPDVPMEPQERFDGYRQQLDLARQITLSTQATALAKSVVEGMLADLDARYLADENRTTAQKIEAIERVRWTTNAIRDNSIREGLRLTLCTRMIALGTSEAKKAWIDRAKLYAAGGDLASAKKDFDALMQDAEVTDDIKHLAQFERMKVLVGQELWSDASADAEVLAKVVLSDAAADSSFPAAEAALAKRLAARVQFANSELTSDQFTQAVDALLQEVLATESPAEEKSEFLAEVALDRARELGARQQWQSALSWAKAAYMVSPNRSVNESVALIQQLLANRSRTSFADGATLAKDPADLVAAEAFYQRQSGSKSVANSDGTATTTVTLKADLSNNAEFPLQLGTIGTPLTGDVKDAVAQVAAGHADLQTRALAHGLLCDADNAIAAMSQAIDALELESREASGLVNFTARFVRGKLESVALANAFLESQVNGPAGSDGELGTEDDKPNPLAPAQE